MLADLLIRIAQGLSGVSRSSHFGPRAVGRHGSAHSEGECAPQVTRTASHLDPMSVLERGTGPDRGQWQGKGDEGQNVVGQLRDVGKVLKNGEESGDRESLATADENNLHGAEVTNAESTALSDRMAQFDDEDRTEKADADGDNDVEGALQPHPFGRAFGRHDVDAVDHRPSHPEPNRYQCHQHRKGQQGPSVSTSQCFAHHMHLHDQRDHGAHDEHRLEDDAQDRYGVSAGFDSRVVAGKEGIDLFKRGGEMNRLEKQAHDVEQQSQAIENKDG